MRTPRGHCRLLAQRLDRIRRYEDLRAFVGSPQFLASMGALPEMTLSDRLITLGAYARALRRCDETAPLAPVRPWEGIVRWNDERIALLRRLNAQYGDDAIIARKLGLPLPKVTTARHRYCGPRAKPARPNTPVAYATAA